MNITLHRTDPEALELLGRIAAMPAPALPTPDEAAAMVAAIADAPDRKTAEAAYLRARRFWANNGPDSLAVARFRTEATTAAALALA